MSQGVKLCRVEVISAYPITPQTTIVEELSEMCASGELDATYIKVESEHSTMAALVGASTAGARTFTASSGNGLLYMHEVLHWTAGARLPVVMANVNRAVSGVWNIWAGQIDSLSQRDTGWIQIYCESNQEVLDSVIMGFKLAEKVLLPVMIAYDAFFLSHTSEIVDVPEIEDVDAFLPPYVPPVKPDFEDPRMFGGFFMTDHFYEHRYSLHRPPSMPLITILRFVGILTGRLEGPMTWLKHTERTMPMSSSSRPGPRRLFHESPSMPCVRRARRSV